MKLGKKATAGPRLGKEEKKKKQKECGAVSQKTKG